MIVLPFSIMDDLVRYFNVGMSVELTLICA